MFDPESDGSVGFPVGLPDAKAQQPLFWRGSPFVEFYVVDNGGSKSARFSLPFIKEYCRRHGYSLIVDTSSNDQKRHPSWQMLLAHRKCAGDFVISWDTNLMPLPHAPPLSRFICCDKLNMCGQPISRRLRRRLVGRGFESGGITSYLTNLIGIPKSYADVCEEIYESADAISKRDDMQLYLNSMLVKRIVDVHQLDNGWNVASPRFIDLGRLQRSFAVRASGNRCTQAYQSGVLHDHYFGATIDSRHGGQLIELVERLKQTEIRGAEIGVFRGETSAQLLGYFPGLMLSMVDAWTTYSSSDSYYRSGDRSARRTEKEQQVHYKAALSNTQFAENRRRLLEMDSVAAAKPLADASLDFVFIDGDHCYEGVRRDIAAWSPKVRSGGIISGHDYGHPRDRRGIWGVSRAVSEYAERYQLKVNVGRETVWWIYRP